MSEEKTICQFKKNANETVMVKFTQFKGKRLIDIRAYYAAENGDLKPTPKGISISRDLISELKEAIDKAAEEWERELPGGGPRDDKNIRGSGGELRPERRKDDRE